MKPVKNSGLVGLMFFIAYGVAYSTPIVIIPPWGICIGMIVSALVYVFGDTFDKND